jgi:hypothetical protein
MKRSAASLLLLLLCAGTVASTSAAGDRADEEIQRAEAATPNLAVAKTAQLVPLCELYYQHKQYERLLLCLDRLEQNIASGDRRAGQSQADSTIANLHALRQDPPSLEGLTNLTFFRYGGAFAVGWLEFGWILDEVQTRQGYATLEDELKQRSQDPEYQAYAEAAELTDATPTLYRLRTRAYLELGDYARAREQGRKHVAYLDSPEYVEAVRLKGRLLKQDVEEERKAWLDAQGQTRWKDFEKAMAKAMAALDAKDPAAEVEAQRRLDRQSAAIDLSLAYALAGDEGAALAQIKELDQQSVDGRLTAATVHMASRRFAAALPLVQSAVSELQAWKADLQAYDQEYQTYYKGDCGPDNCTESAKARKRDASGRAAMDEIADELEARRAGGRRSVDLKFMLNKCLLETNQADAAKRGYDELLASSAIRQSGELYWVVAHDRGRIAQLQGNVQEAIAFYRMAVDELERQRGTVGRELYRVGYVEDKQSVYRDLASVLTIGAESRAAPPLVKK